MTSRSAMRAKRWNERLRLVITAFNLTAVGTFGLAVTAPLLKKGGLVFARSDGASLPELKLFEGFSPLDLVAWDAAGAALLLHVFAHILVGLTESEG